MKKRVIAILLFTTLLCAGCGETSGVQTESSINTGKAEVVAENNNEDNNIIADAKSDDEVEAGYENELTPAAIQMIEELGVSKEGEVMITRKQYDDRDIYNEYRMTSDNKMTFYTHVFYKSKDVYVSELNNPNHRGEILKKDGKLRYMLTEIEKDVEITYAELPDYKLGEILEQDKDMFINQKETQKGALTIEATIVLTTMIFFVLFIMDIGRVYRAQNYMTHSIYQTSKYLPFASHRYSLPESGTALAETVMVYFGFPRDKDNSVRSLWRNNKYAAAYKKIFEEGIVG